MIILSLESITKQYAERPILDAITLGVERGDRIGIVGINGSGKTTLLRIAAKAEPPDAGRISMARDLRVTYLPQNPQLDGALTVIEQLFSGDTPSMTLLRAYEQTTLALAQTPNDPTLQHHHTTLIAQMDATDTWTLENDARTILNRLGITDLNAKIGDLSGGQRKRVAMAAALITPADLLILDEPTNHIDTATIDWLESFLIRTNAALLLVTHDRYFLDRVVGRIIELDSGKLYSYTGNYSHFLERKAERATQQRTDEERRQTILRKELAWLRRGARARTTKQQARIDRIDALHAAEPETARGELNISVATRRLGKRIIEIQHLRKSYGTRTLIRDLTLSIAPRARLGIIGPNGSGKTTLLNLIAGRIPNDHGTITIGETVHLGYYDQESAGLDETQRLIDYVKDGAELLNTGTGTLITAAQMLERFLFPAATHYTPIAKLSGGERRRLYLLRTLIAAPNVLLLDEPTNDLDIQTLSILEDYLDDFAGALIVVSHDRYFLDRTIEHLLIFEGEGTIVTYPGNYSTYTQLLQQRETQQPTPPDRTRTKPAPQQPTTRARKLTFREARELPELEKQIATLETQQRELSNQINASSGDYRELQRLTTELETITTTLETAIERWAELAELADGTETTNNPA